MTSDPTIIFEDDVLLVLNKPAGLVVHTDGRTTEPTLDEWVLLHYPTLRDVGGLHTLDNERYVPRVGLLHRLDRDTSGVILAAKTDDAFHFLQRQFLDRSIEKEYIALVHGVPDPKKGTIDLPLGRSRTDFRKWTTPPDARGTLRKALTEYEVIQEGGGYALVVCRPKTGRTNQIRVHMAAIGHPLVGDVKYGGTPVLGMNRAALHARALSFTHPLTGKRMTVEAPLPEDVENALAQLQNF